MIMMTIIPFVYYSLNRYARLCNTYLTLCVAISLLSIILSMSERFAHPSYRRMRALIFTSFGLYGVLPYIHWIFLESETFTVSTKLSQSNLCITTICLLYLIGSGLYATQIPERYFPGKCDIYLHSHQIFHFLVTIAALIQYYGLVNLVEHVRSVDQI